MERRFEQALRAKAASGLCPVIADLKAFSPKEGDLFRGRRAADLARTLQEAGAPALSVVTEGCSFRGSLAALAEVARETGLPVLRKDFVRTERDLEETARSGAAAILLIAAMHGARELESLFRAAHALGLEVLLEAHTAEELRLAMELGARLVGINNRDILDLERDGGTVATTETLLGQAERRDSLLISESGIAGPEDVRRAMRAGADAVLVGTAILRAADPAAFYQSLERGGGRRCRF